MANFNDNTPPNPNGRRSSNLLWIALIAVIIIAALSYASKNKTRMDAQNNRGEQTTQGYSGNTANTGANVPSTATTTPSTPNNAMTGTGNTGGATTPESNGSWGTSTAPVTSEMPISSDISPQTGTDTQ